MDIALAGTYGPVFDDPSLSAGVISAGTVVNSYILHLDPQTPDKFVLLEGSVFFNEEILGVIVVNNDTVGMSLNDSDFLGMPGVTYPQADARQLDSREGGNDVLTLSADLRTVTVKLGVKQQVDQVRIITLAAGN